MSFTMVLTLINSAKVVHVYSNRLLQSKCGRMTFEHLKHLNLIILSTLVCI